LAGRSPAEAVNAFLEPLSRALSCFTRAVLDVSGGYHVAERPHALTLAGGEPVQLQAQIPLWLSIFQNYRIVEWEGARGPWKVQTVGYFYALELDRIELISFQWHPVGQSWYQRPHLHLGPAAELGFKDLQHSHLPTGGRVAVEDILRLAVELGAQPRRSDWDEILETTQGAFEEWRPRS